MELVIKVDNIVPSTSNVRKKHTKEAIVMMANSIRNRGIINMPCVALKDDGKYEVIAGGLRVLGARAAELEEITCFDMTALTESERIEVSLAENIDRKDMTIIQTQAAYNKLFKAGMPVASIASRFDKTERRVHQILAIGSLPQKLLDLADNEEIGDRTLIAMAIAPRTEVTRFMKLKPNERPRDWEISDWLGGEAGMYKQKNALFNIDDYDGPTMVDLFAEEDETWLLDGAQFIALQDGEIKQRLDDYDRKGWKCIEVDRWQPYAYDKISKANGGQVIWSRDERSQSVEFHVGYLREKRAGKAPEAKGSNGKPEAKAETSQAFDAFMAETRHAAVCRHMMDSRVGGLIGTIVVLLKQCDNISLSSQGCGVKNEDQIQSLNCDDNIMAVARAFNEMKQELKIKDGMLWDIKTPALIKRLDALTLATLQDYVSLIIAYRWNLVGSGEESNAIGKGLGLKVVNIWEADDAFWNAINNKKTLIKIAKDNKIPIDEKATTKVIRAIVSEKIPDSWRPSWLSF